MENYYLDIETTGLDEDQFFVIFTMFFIHF